MRDNRGIKNIIFGLLNQAVTIGFGLILPRMFIMSYGSEVNGLLSSVSQIYVYIALLEAGIGTASLHALYKTLSFKDYNETNRVLAATNRFYRRTGFYYLLSVITLSIVFPHVLKTDISKLTVSLVVLLNGLGDVINFFFQGKYRILLRAEGKNYFLSNLSTGVHIVTNILKIVLIHLGFNIVVIQFSYFVVSLGQMSIIMLYIKKQYNWIDLNVTPNFYAISARSSVMVHRIANLIFSNTDVLILTFMTGLKVVSVYSLYSSFFNMIKSILFSFLDGVQYALAQTFHSDFPSFLKMQERFEASYMTLTFALYSVLYILITPFLTLYTKNITDIQYVDKMLPLLFTLVFLLQGARGPMQLVTEYAQHFKQTRSQAIIETGINLIVTITSVYKFGIYGALIGTIAALLYRANAIIIYANRKILKKSPLVTYKRWGWNVSLFLILFVINRMIDFRVDNFYTFVILAVLSSLCVFGIYSLGLRVFERDAFYWLINVLKKKIPFKKCI